MKTKNRYTQRAARLFGAHGIIPEQRPVLAALVAFACQNPGLELRNYYDPADLYAGRKQTYLDGKRAFASEARSIQVQFTRFKVALDEFLADGGQDDDLLAVAPHAFSGRLEWIAGPEFNKGPAFHTGLEHWNYTTGQYWPTEYRKAASVLLEAAANKVRRSRPPKVKMPRSIAELKELAKANGSHWFSRGSMAFFGTRICGDVIKGKYFVTSEQSPHNPRAYTLRSFDAEGNVNTVGEFQEFTSAAAARAFIPKAQANSETAAAA